MKSEPSSRHVRSLGPLEEFFWRTGVAWPITVLLTAELEGEAPPVDWEAAARAVQAKYQLFRVAVEKTAGERPSFVECDAGLAVDRHDGSGGQIETILDVIDERKLGFAEPLLARFVVFDGEGSVRVTLAASHTSLDGRAATAIMQDFLAAAVGEALAGEEPMPASINSYFIASCSAAYELTDPAGEIELPPYRPARQISTAVLSRDTTTALREQARKEVTTVQGALVAAFLIAGRLLDKSWRSRDVLCLSPIDLRRFIVGDGQSLQGMLIGVQPIGFPMNGPTDFWGLARYARAEIIRQSDEVTIAEGLRQTCAVVANDGNPDEPASIDPNNLLNHDFMVTNYGAIPLRLDFGGLRLTRLFPAINGGKLSDTQTISLITIDGVMCLTHQSVKPIPDHLSTAVRLLSKLAID